MKIGDLPAFLLCVIRVVSYFTYCLDTRIDSEYTRDNAFSEPVKREIASADRLMLIDGSRIYVYNKRIAG